MININTKPVITQITVNKHCAEFVIINYEKASIGFLSWLGMLAYIINTTSYYPDLIGVIDINDLPEFERRAVIISSFVKVQK